MFSQTDPGRLLTIALPKGRMQAECLRLLTAIGLDGQAVSEDSRSLLFHSPGQPVRYLLARPADVPTYVERGAADLGFTGKDVLLEEQPDVYELLDLGFGRCRFVLAGPRRLAELPLSREHFPQRVATKFPRIARAFFARQQWPVDLIFLHGAVELAPNVGMADLIVDIVSTGQTLAENGLAVLSEILPSSMRLIANRASFILKSAEINQIRSSLQQLTLREDC